MKSHFVGNILRIAVRTCHIRHGFPIWYFKMVTPYTYFYGEMLPEGNNSQTVPLIFSYFKGAPTNF